MNLVDAAAKGGDSLLVLALAVAGVVISVLFVIVVWLVKDRLAATRRRDDTLEKRLSAGAQTMESLKISVEQLQTKFVELIGELMKRDDFESYRKEHTREHDRLDDKVSDVRERQVELTQRVETSLKSMTSMLSKLVSLNNPMVTGGESDS